MAVTEVSEDAKKASERIQVVRLTTIITNGSVLSAATALMGYSLVVSREALSRGVDLERRVAIGEQLSLIESKARILKGECNE